MKGRKYTINVLSGAGMDEAIRGVEDFRPWIVAKSKELAERCAKLGAKVANVMFQTTPYDGPRDVQVRFEQRGDSTYAVVASGTTVWFIEYGSGIMMGRGHPEAKERGFGPGTWSDGPQGKGHWKDPNGWYLPKEKGGGHSFGNPPAGAMYSGRKEIELELTNIVREVFSDD